LNPILSSKFKACMPTFEHEIYYESYKDIAISRIDETLQEELGPSYNKVFSEEHLLFPPIFSSKFKYSVLSLTKDFAKGLVVTFIKLHGGVKAKRKKIRVELKKLPVEYVQLIYNEVVMPYIKKAGELNHGDVFEKPWYTVALLRELESYCLTCYPIDYGKWKVVHAFSDDLEFLKYRFYMKKLAQVSQQKALGVGPLALYDSQIDYFKKVLFLDKDTVEF